MDFDADRDNGPNGDPSLAEMTIAALSILQRNARGFFLFIEGKFDKDRKRIHSSFVCYMMNT